LFTRVVEDVDPYRFLKIPFVIGQTDWVRWAIVLRVVEDADPYRFLKTFFVIGQTDWFRFATVLREDDILPYERETRSEWFRYAIFQKLKPVGSEAVRRVSSLEKKQSNFTKQRVSQKK